MQDVSPRLSPLLAQLDTSLAIATDRMRGLDDEEFWWAPGPGALTLVPDAQGRLRPQNAPEDDPRSRTIALLVGHLGEMAVMRADYTDGDHQLARDGVDLPDTADAGLTFIAEGWARWRSVLAGLADHELDVVGRSAFPWGLDPTLPILDIAWWMNRELIHHMAEIAFIRDLYATRELR